MTNVPLNGPAHPPLPTTSLLPADRWFITATHNLPPANSKNGSKAKTSWFLSHLLTPSLIRESFRKLQHYQWLHADCRWGSLPLYAPISSKAFLSFRPALTILSTFCFTHRNCRVSTFSFLHQQCVGMEMFWCWSRRALGNKCAENIYFVSHAASLHHRRREIIIYTKQTIARGKSFFPFRWIFARQPGWK